MKLDLKDAYLSVPVFQTHRQWLRFQWQNRTYQFDTLPFGLSSAPFVFTKLLKPVVTVLRQVGVRLVLYLDNMIIMARSENEAQTHLASAMHVLTALGVILNLEKSVLTPVQRIEFLGFCLDSCSMTVSLPRAKIHSIRSLVREVNNQDQVSMLKLSLLIGTMVSTHPAILPAPLYYRQLERAKICQLGQSQSYNAMVTVFKEMREDLTWWLKNIHAHNQRTIHWDKTIESDASMQGWGTSCEGTSTGGQWRNAKTTPIT